MSTTTKLEHKTRSHEMEAAVTPEIVAPAPLAGAWKNTNSATRDLVEIVITAAGANLFVHAYGACSPKPCDWGNVAGMAYSSGVSSTPAIAFTASYKFSFSTVTLVGHLAGAILNVESITHFTDGSGRNDYYAQMQMKK
jgi:hypothetical protein